MFYRGNVQKRKLLKPRSHKKKAAINQPEWDSTVQDLTVHAASPEELLRRRIRRKSKNADVARREILAKKKGIPVDLMLSPGQVELEIKKLAVLREVLYDHNDFNEVLKKTDQTMASVKNIFHDSVARRSGHPNITLAPGSRLPPPIQAESEQPSRLDALSDSVMDNQALNDNNSSADESDQGDEDAQFESKVDYERFLSLLKDSMNNPKNRTMPDTIATTPEKDDAARDKVHGALNCTEEVKRTLSRISSIKDAEEEEEKAKLDQTRKIDKVISGLNKDASKLEKKLDNSLNPIVSARPMPNHAPCNMTYDDLQGAMENVGKMLSAFEKRTGRNQNVEKSAPNCGLAGFTVTLIDSVTRLTTYVNEAEIRGQELEASLECVKCKLDHQVKVNEALALELVNTQKVIRQGQEEMAVLKQEIQNEEEKRSIKWEEEKEALERNMIDLAKVVTDLENKLIISEHSLVDEAAESRNNLSDMELVDARFSNKSQAKLKEKEDQALKSDMSMLLKALKSQNDKVAWSQKSLPPSYSTVLRGGTPGASKTVASVESHLRHLQLQHAEAQQRMDELTKQAQMYPPADGRDSAPSNTASPSSFTDEGVASFPSRAFSKQSSHYQQSRGAFATDSAMAGPLPSNQFSKAFSQQQSDGAFATDSNMNPLASKQFSKRFSQHQSHAAFAADSNMESPLSKQFSRASHQQSRGEFATDSNMQGPLPSQQFSKAFSQKQSDGAFATDSNMNPLASKQFSKRFSQHQSRATFPTDSNMEGPLPSKQLSKAFQQQSHGAFTTDSSMHGPFPSQQFSEALSHQQSDEAFTTPSSMAPASKQFSKRFSQHQSRATFATDSNMKGPSPSKQFSKASQHQSRGAFTTESSMKSPLSKQFSKASQQQSRGAFAANSNIQGPLASQKFSKASQHQSHATFAADSRMQGPMASKQFSKRFSEHERPHATFASDQNILTPLPIRRSPRRPGEQPRSSMKPTASAAYYCSPPTQDYDTPTKESVANDLSYEPDSDAGSFKMLEEDTSETSAIVSTGSSGVEAPVASEQQQEVLCSIQKTQTSLEDRITELNKQHTEAQERLQKLVARRKQERANRRGQMTPPCCVGDSLDTPQSSNANLPVPESSSEWFALSTNLDNINQ